MTYVAEWDAVTTDNSNDALELGTVVTYVYNDNYQPETPTPFRRLEFAEPPYASIVNGLLKAVSDTYQDSGEVSVNLLINRPPRLVPRIVTILHTSLSDAYATFIIFDENTPTCVWEALGTPLPGDTLTATFEIEDDRRGRVVFHRPTDGWSIGTYRRTIRVQDEFGEWSSEVTATLEVIPDDNDPPVPAPDINFDCSFMGCEIDVTAHFTDPEGDELGNWLLTDVDLILGATINNDTGIITVPQNVPLGVYPITVTGEELTTDAMLTGTSVGWTITIENPQQLKKPSNFSLALDPATN